MRIILLFLLAVFTTTHVNSQTYDFDTYSEKDGMAQDFIYTINQDANGYLWIGTGNGLCRFDGKQFIIYSSANGLAEDIITTSFEQSNGVNWFGHMQGGVTKFENGKFIEIKCKTEIKSQVISIYGVNNLVYFITQNDGLFVIENDEIKFIGKFDLDILSDFYIIDENNICISSSNGLSHLVKNKVWKVKKRYNRESNINSISGLSSKNTFILGLESGGIDKVKLKNGSLKFQEWENKDDFSNVIVKSVFEDSQKDLWLIIAGNGVIKIDFDDDNTLEFKKYNEDTGLKSNYIQCLFEDFEGNIWFGSFGAGLSKLSDNSFTFYDKGKLNVYAYVRNETSQWLGTDKGFIEKPKGIRDSIIYYNASNGFINDDVISLFKDENNLWIGTLKSGLFVQDLTTKNINKIRWPYGSLHHRINQLVVSKGVVYAATNGGLIIYNTILNTYKLLSTDDGLTHNAVKAIYLSKDGKIYFGMRSQNLFVMNNGNLEEIRIVEGGDIEIIDIAQKSDGSIIVATSDNGIFIVGDDGGVVRYYDKDGLKSNYSYAIEIDEKDNIWVGHRDGLSKINTADSTVKVFSDDYGITGQVNFGAMFRDSKNKLWIGTDAGLIEYNRAKEKQSKTGPQVNLLKVLVNDVAFDLNKPIELPYGQYRIEFTYVGISFKDPESVEYRFLLDGYDGEYSNLSKENRCTYGNLSDGEYSFQVKAYNKDLNSNEASTLIKIVIRPPFWKRWWFFVSCFGVLLALFWLFDRIRSKRLREQKEKLESQLIIKTKEVVEKAEKIEEINKDLTSSISYAERIQSAILPTKEYLLESLPGAFVYFMPRDVVSGDFYFVRRIENKLIVACVDCTGHGVPGAFMSMIGSVTLRNIYKSMEATKKWLTPELVLEKLDNEIQTILKQKEQDETDFFRSRDGMDLTISEINLDTKEVLVSSAKRHYIIKKDGEFVTYSGDKRSIGGGYKVIDKFTVSKFDLNTNDSFYMFTDGFPDQFGGENRKKLKVSGVRKMILEMEDEKNISKDEFVKTYFESWKRNIFQIDDVLFIGIDF